MHKFENIENIERLIDRLDVYVQELKMENSNLIRENKELLSVIEDRDLEILQLQENLSQKNEEKKEEETEMADRLQGLLGRMQSMVTDEKSEEEFTSY